MQVNEPQQVLASTQPCVQVHSPTSAHAHDESSGYEGLGEVVHATAAIGIVSIVISIPIAAVAAKALLCRWLSSPVAAVRGWSIILASVSVSAWARSSVRLQIFIKGALLLLSYIRSLQARDLTALASTEDIPSTTKIRSAPLIDKSCGPRASSVLLPVVLGCYPHCAASSSMYTAKCLLLRHLARAPCANNGACCPAAACTSQRKMQ